MKKLSKLLVLVLALTLCFTVLAACNTDDCEKNGHNYGSDGKCTVCGLSQCDAEGHNWVNAKCTVCGADYDIHDYVSDLKLDESSSSAKYTAPGILKQYVDGDTTHFWVPSSIVADGILKARYLAVNTPESTGKIEPYGKIASNFTHDTLKAALDNGGAILLESDTDDGKWNNDSYGRMLVWVWYRPSADADWRNLNLELLQKGYAYGSNSGANRYGDTCVAALNQAVEAKLVVQSGLDDETFYYGDAIELNLKQLRTNLKAYEGKKVAFEGTVTMLYSGGSYVEDLDEVSGVVYGIYIYYGTEKTAKVLEILGTPGNRVRVVGTLSDYYGSWQVSGVQYRMGKPDDPSNLQLISEGNDAYYQKLTVSEFFGNKTVSVWDDEKEDNVDKIFPLCELVLNTTVSMDNLTVVSAYTTNNGGSNDGAISLTCKDAAGNEITVRTNVLYKDDGTLVKQSEFLGQTISVKGIVDYYSDANQYQIKVLQYSDITFASKAA